MGFCWMAFKDRALGWDVERGTARRLVARQHVARLSYWISVRVATDIHYRCRRCLRIGSGTMHDRLADRYGSHGHGHGAGSMKPCCP